MCFAEGANWLQRVLSEEGKPDPAVRKGSKKHVTECED